MDTIMLVDDDKEMLALTSEHFRSIGYAVKAFTRGTQAIAALSMEPVDCVVLDVRMPELSGFDVCQRIRQISTVPILFLTGQIDEEDKVNGLLLGADDYIEKPFSFRELEARVQAAIRRSKISSTPDTLVFPPLEFDLQGRRVLCNGDDLQLSVREFDILLYFATSGKDIIPYEDIGIQVWGVYQEQDRRSVMVIVSRLRKKLDIDPLAVRMIETVWSVGYRFVGKQAGKGIPYEHR